MVRTYQIITKSPGETAQFGQTFGTDLIGKGSGLPRILCLKGELGSGKTTFTQGFAKGLGIKSRLLSPTFIIVRRYIIPDLNSFFYHIDLYRVKNQNNLISLGLNEILLNDTNVIVIEWAEKITGLMPKNRYEINFDLIDDKKRRITITQYEK